MRPYRFFSTLGLILMSTPALAYRGWGSDEVPAFKDVAVPGRKEALPIPSYVIDSEVKARREWLEIVPLEKRRAMGLMDTSQPPMTLAESKEKLVGLDFAALNLAMKLHLPEGDQKHHKDIKDMNGALAYFKARDGEGNPAVQLAQQAAGRDTVITRQFHPAINGETGIAGSTVPYGPMPDNSGPAASEAVTAKSQEKSQEKSDPKSEEAEFLEYSEAFEPTRPVYGVKDMMISQESLDATHPLGWKVSFTPDQSHWPTLSWTSADTRSTVSLFSSNAIRQLEVLNRAPIEGKKGIVFGKVLSDWDVEILGLEQAPVLLSLDLQRVISEAPAGVTPLADQLKSQDPANDGKYFAFVNVPAGEHVLVYKYRGLNAPHTAATQIHGAVPTLVQAGRATQIELTDIRRQNVSGVVAITKHHQEEAQGTVVRVLGQDNAAALAGQDGVFSLDVMTAGNYPVIFETDKGTSDYTYRQRVLPGEMDRSVVLRRLPPARIQKFLNQLPGANIGAGGLIIGRANHIVDHLSEDTMLYPVIGYPEGVSASEIRSNQTGAETFVRNPEGELLGGFDARLNRYNKTFFGIHVPEGAALVSVKDENGNLIVSRHVPTQFFTPNGGNQFSTSMGIVSFVEF